VSAGLSWARGARESADVGVCLGKQGDVSQTRSRRHQPAPILQQQHRLLHHSQPSSHPEPAQSLACSIVCTQKPQQENSCRHIWQGNDPAPANCRGRGWLDRLSGCGRLTVLHTAHLCTGMAGRRRPAARPTNACLELTSVCPAS
jgi:hypothetical protein